MLQSLERRLFALEQLSSECDQVMFIILVGIGKVGMEITHIHDNHGKHWNRRLEETENDFKDRATSESPRKENQVALLFGEINNVGHWRDSSGQISAINENKWKHSLTPNPA